MIAGDDSDAHDGSHIHNHRKNNIHITINLNHIYNVNNYMTSSLAC